MKALLSAIIMAATSHALSASIYEHKLIDIDGNETSLNEHNGKVILIVNVASRCGFTRQYKKLEELYQEYKDQGLVVCGFPCNQFGGQEPGSEKEIKKFCSLTYGVTFPLYAKILVNGADRHPLYEELVGDDSRISGKIKWNFTKILVGRDGTPIERYGALTSPNSRKLRKTIENALNTQP
jgi:glutathione peroxidase